MPFQELYFKVQYERTENPLQDQHSIFIFAVVSQFAVYPNYMLTWDFEEENRLPTLKWLILNKLTCARNKTTLKNVENPYPMWGLRSRIFHNWLRRNPYCQYCYIFLFLCSVERLRDIYVLRDAILKPIASK